MKIVEIKMQSGKKKKRSIKPRKKAQNRRKIFKYPFFAAPSFSFLIILSFAFWKKESRKCGCAILELSSRIVVEVRNQSFPVSRFQKKECRNVRLCNPGTEFQDCCWSSEPTTPKGLFPLVVIRFCQNQTGPLCSAFHHTLTFIPMGFFAQVCEMLANACPSEPRSA